MNEISSASQLPEIAFQDKLIEQLKSIKNWENVSEYQKECQTESFMDAVGHLFIEYFQFHLEEAQAIGNKYAKELSWAIKPINIFYIIRLWSRLVNADDWADFWEIACWGGTNIEAFHEMFGDSVGMLDAAGIWEYMEERKDIEELDRGLIPKNVPYSHWWWFTKYGSKKKPSDPRHC